MRAKNFAKKYAGRQYTSSRGVGTIVGYTSDGCITLKGAALWWEWSDTDYTERIIKTFNGEVKGSRGFFTSTFGEENLLPIKEEKKVFSYTAKEIAEKYTGMLVPLDRRARHVAGWAMVQGVECFLLGHDEGYWALAQLTRQDIFCLTTKAYPRIDVVRPGSATHVSIMDKVTKIEALEKPVVEVSPIHQARTDLANSFIKRFPNIQRIEIGDKKTLVVLDDGREGSVACHYEDAKDDRIGILEGLAKALSLPEGSPQTRKARSFTGLSRTAHIERTEESLEEFDSELFQKNFLDLLKRVNKATKL